MCGTVSTQISKSNETLMGFALYYLLYKLVKMLQFETLDCKMRKIRFKL